MAEDKLGRDIRSRLKAVSKTSGNYAKNTAKLFLASGQEMFNIQMPIIGSMIETNRDVLNDTARFLRNPSDSINRQVDRALNSDSYKSLQKLASAALDDLKTGNLYDKNRDRTEIGQEMDDLLSDFGGFDMTGFDENGDWTEKESDPSIAANIKIAEVQEDNASKRTEATLDAIGASTHAIIDTSNANAQNNIRLKIKQHSQMMSAMENVLTSQNATFKAITTTMTASLELSREAHNQIMGEMKDIKALLTDIKNSVAVTNKPNIYKEHGNVFGNNGEIDIKNYFKTIGKHMNDKYAIGSTLGMMTGGMDIKSLVDTVISNPLMLVSSAILNAIVPKSTKQSMGNTNRNIQAFFPALLQKFSDRGNQFNDTRKISDFVMGLFGVDSRSRAHVDTSAKDLSDKVNFTKRTATAIETVIPMMLSRIDSHLSGGPVMIYNYSTGKLEKAAGVVSQYEYGFKNLTGKMGESRNTVMQMAGSYNFKSSKDSKDFQNFVNQYLQKQAEDNRLINPYTSKDEFKDNMPFTTGNSDMYYSLLQGILRNMPRDKLMQLSSEMSSARSSRDRSTFNTNNELKDNGLIGAWGGYLDDKLISNLSNASKNTQYGLYGDDLDKEVSKYNESAYKNKGLKSPALALNSILNTLQKGVLSYSYVIGSNKGGPSEMNDIIKDVMSASKGQYHAESLILERSRRDKAFLEDNRRREYEQSAKRSKDHFELRDQYIDDETSPEYASLIMKDYISHSTKKNESNNPGVEVYRQLTSDVTNKVSSVFNELPMSKKLSKIGKTAFNTPFKLVNTGLKLMDQAMFKLIYGEDAEKMFTESGNEPSLLSMVSNVVKTQLTSVKNWFDKSIVNPLRKSLFDKDNGLITRIGRSLGNEFQPVKSAFNNIKGKFMAGASNVFKGTKDENGKWSNGIFSGTLNKYDKFQGSIESQVTNGINHLLYGKFSDSDRKGTHKYRVFGKSKEHGGIQTEYDGVIGHMKQGFDKLSTWLLGDDKNNDSHKKFKIFNDEMKKTFPDMVAGGIKGFGASLGLGVLTGLWLPGGPLMGGIIGSGINFIKSSDKFKDFIFGKEIVDEKTGKITREGNLISGKIYDGVKKFAPKIGKGAAIGAIAGGMGLLPFGITPAIGAVLGSIGGMSSASDKIKSLIFGNAEDPKSGLISKDFRQKAMDQIKKVAPSALGGAMIGNSTWGLISSLGIIPGLSLIPGGPIFSMLGAITGGVNAKSINKFFFGESIEEDELGEDGKPTGKKVKKQKGGIFSDVFDKAKDRMISPFTKKIDAAGDKIEKWFNETIVGSLKRTTAPLKAQLGNAGQSIKDSFNAIGGKITDGILSALGVNKGDKTNKEFFHDKILKPMENMASRLFNAIGKVIGSIISAPFKALEYMVTGTIGGKTLGERGDERREARDYNRRERNKERRQNRRDRVQQTRDKFSYWFDNVGANFSAGVGNTKDKFSNFNTKVKSWFFGSSNNNEDDYNYKEPREKSYSYSNSFNITDSKYNDVDVGTPKKSRFASWKEERMRISDERKNTRENRYRDFMLNQQEKRDKNYKEKQEREAKIEADRQKRLSVDYSDRSKSNKKYRSDNSYLSEITRYNRKIFDEIKGQLGGTGWNLSYIKTLLAKQYGGLKSSELPEEMEGSSKTVKKRRGFFGKFKDRASDLLGKTGDKVKYGISRGMDFLLYPFHIISTGAEYAGKALKGFGGALFSIVKTLGSIAAELAKGAAKTLAELSVGAAKFIKGLAGGIGKAVGDSVGLVTGVLKQATIGLAAGVRGLFEIAADIAPDLASMAWSGIKGLGKLIGRGAVGLGKGAAHGIGWLFSKIGGHNKDESNPKSLKQKLKTKYLGKVKIDGGFLDKIKDEIPIKIGSNGHYIPFPVVSLTRGKTMTKISHAIPVYIAGGFGNVNNKINASSTPQKEANKLTSFKRTYSKTDSRASHANDVGSVYDEAIRNASSQDEVTAIALSQQLNANNKVLATGTGTTGKSSNFIEDLLTNGSGGILSKILKTIGTPAAAALGGTALAGVLGKVVGGAKLGANALGSTVAGNLPFIAGTAMAAKNGDAVRFTENTARQSFKIGTWAAKSASGALDILTAPTGTALSKNAAGVGAKLLAGLRGAIGKLLSNKTVQSLLSKVPGINTSNITETVLSKFDDVLLKLGSEGTQKLLAKANWVIMGVEAAIDVARGMYKASDYFDVDASDVTWGMRISAGLANGLSGLAFGVIPVSWLSQAIYKIVAKKEQEQELTKKQSNLQEKVKSYNASNNTTYTVDEYEKNVDKNGNKKVSVWSKIKNFFSSGSSTDSTIDNTSVGLGTGFGKGPMKRFSQRDSRWNHGSNDMAKAGCGPTAAAMVASAYGKGPGSANPLEASGYSYMTGNRAADGGTNPNFFSTYASAHGYGMKEGPTDSNMIHSNLASGRPIVFMGKGGAFGNNMHYLVGQSNSGTNGINIVDPLSGSKKTFSTSSLMKNAKNTIYSYGKGSSDASDTIDNAKVSQAQTALVSKMKSKEGQIQYSTAAGKQDPDTGYASCASMVAWVYKKVLNINNMSASSSSQATDSRFYTVYQSGIKSDGTGKGSYDLSVMQPGDIIYYRRSYKNALKTPYHIGHTEMYIGNGQRMGHGGGANGKTPGPTTKDMDSDVNNIVMVRRLRNFTNGNPITVYDNGSSSSDSSSTQSKGDMVLDSISNAIGSMGTSLDNILNPILTGDAATGSTDTNSNNTTVNTDMSKINGTDTSGKIWNYFKSKGLTNYAAAGIMGNLFAESGLNPSNLQNSANRHLNVTDSQYTSNVNNGTYTNFSNDNSGYGLAQWTTSGRKSGLFAKARSSDKSIDDLGTQLDYLWSELQNNYTNSVLTPLKRSSSVKDASTVFLQKFEAPASKDSSGTINSRANYAQNYFSTYANADSSGFGAGPGLYSQYGTGTAANSTLLNEQIKNINNTITAARSKASSTSTAAAATNTIKHAIENTTNTGDANETLVNMIGSISTSLGTMIELLSSIKDNTEKASESSDNTEKSNLNNLPVAQSNNNSSNDVGSNIINKLTSK